MGLRYSEDNFNRVMVKINPAFALTNVVTYEMFSTWVHKYMKKDRKRKFKEAARRAMTIPVELPGMSSPVLLPPTSAPPEGLPTMSNSRNNLPDLLSSNGGDNLPNAPMER